MEIYIHTLGRLKAVQVYVCVIRFNLTVMLFPVKNTIHSHKDKHINKCL